MIFKSQYDSAFYYSVRTDEAQGEVSAKGLSYNRLRLVLRQGPLAGDDASIPSRPSEHDLGPKVHLLGGIILHSRLQQPFGLHPLDILHVPFVHQSCSCGWKGGKNEANVCCGQRKPNLCRDSQA